MKTIPFFLIIILSLFPSFSFSGEGACLQGDCINGQGNKIYSDEDQYVGKEQTPDYLKKQKKIAEKTNNIETLIDKYGEKCKQYCKVNEDEYNRYCYEACLTFPAIDEL